MKEPTFNEQPKNFKDFIPLDQKMSPQEAIEKLSSFHNNTSPENVIAAFTGLREFEEGTVEFRDSVNSGYPCIIMEGCDNDGKRKWSHLIDKNSGQPQMRCG